MSDCHHSPTSGFCLYCFTAVNAAQARPPCAANRGGHVSTVWKFPLNLYGPDGNITDSPTVDMPDGAQILTLRLQHGQPTLWALVDPDAPLERRRFAIVGTGQAKPDGPTRYVGTWMSDEDGTFVFHVFEELP